MLRNDGDARDEVHLSPVAGGRRNEEVAHHALRELAAVARVLDRRVDLDTGDAAFGGHPETDLMAPAPRVARRPRRRKNRPPRRGGENITRSAARARSRIRAAPRARPGAATTTAPRPLARAAARAG